MGTGRGPEIDVVVPTRDRPALLAGCIDSLLAQTFRSFRLTLVDDAGRVPAQDLLPDRVRQLPDLQILRNEERAGPSASRNRGVAAGKAPYIVFMDDDCRAHPDLLARHRMNLAGGERLVSIGALHPPPARRLPPWNRWEADRLAREQERMARGEMSPTWAHFYTGNAAVRRDGFVRTGGFDERLERQEDVELGFRLHRLGCLFIFDPEAIVWHDTQRSLNTWLQLPGKSAHGDVLMDAIVPCSGRLCSVQEALGQRHWLLRAARRGPSLPATRRAAVRLAVIAGSALHVVHADRMAMFAFSLVWDLEYSRALARAASGRPSPREPPAGRGRQPPGIP